MPSELGPPGRQQRETPSFVKKRDSSALAASSIGGTTCTICQQISSKGNILEECTKCGIKVHRDCYGLRGIPDTVEWMCRPCEQLIELYGRFQNYAQNGEKNDGIPSFASKSTQHSSSNEIGSLAAPSSGGADTKLRHEFKHLEPYCEICCKRNGAFSEVEEAIWERIHKTDQKAVEVKCLHQKGDWKTAWVIGFREIPLSTKREYNVRWEEEDEPDQWLFRDRIRSTEHWKSSLTPIINDNQLESEWKRIRWIHTSCALCLPLLYIDEYSKKVCGSDNVLKITSPPRQCCVCNKSGPSSAVVVCSKEGCSTCFHVECGLRSGFSFTIRSREQYCGDHCNLGRPKRKRKEPTFFLKESSGAENAKNDMQVGVLGNSGKSQGAKKGKLATSSRTGRAQSKAKGIDGTAAATKSRKNHRSKPRKESVKKTSGSVPTSRMQAEAEYKRGSGRSQRKGKIHPEAEISLGDGAVIKSRDDLWSYIESTYFADVEPQKFSRLQQDVHRSIESDQNLQRACHGSAKRGSKKKKRRIYKRQSSSPGKNRSNCSKNGSSSKVIDCNLAIPPDGKYMDNSRVCKSELYQAEGAQIKSHCNTSPSGFQVQNQTGLCPSPSSIKKSMELVEKNPLNNETRGANDTHLRWKADGHAKKLRDLQNRLRIVFEDNQQRLRGLANAAKIATEKYQAAKEEIAETLNLYKKLQQKKEFEESLKLHLAHQEQTAEENEEDVICEVCGDGDECEKGNKIILCDCCDVAVHQKCYGVTKVPSSDWFCRRCELHAFGETCCVCGNPNGALKPTTDGRWAHVVCAFYVPELYLSNDQMMEPIAGVQEISHKRRKLKCLYCDEKNIVIQPFVTKIRLKRTLKDGFAIKSAHRAPELPDLRKESRRGACVQCVHSRCLVAFHPQCARERSIQMEMDPDRRGNQFIIRCDKHRTRNRSYKMSSYYREPKCRKMPPPPNKKLLSKIESYIEEEYLSDRSDGDDACEEKEEGCNIGTSDEVTSEGNDEESESEPKIEEAKVAEIKEHAACQICGHESEWAENRLISCTNCRIRVHHGCYGIKRQDSSNEFTQGPKQIAKRSGQQTFNSNSWLCEPCRPIGIQCWDTERLLQWARDISLPRAVAKALTDRKVTGYKLIHKRKKLTSSLLLPEEHQELLEDAVENLLSSNESEVDSRVCKEDGFLVPSSSELVDTLPKPRCIPCCICGQASPIPTPMKLSEVGGWVHLTCALWTMETSFGDVTKLSPVINIHKIFAARRHPRCQICQKDCRHEDKEALQPVRTQLSPDQGNKMGACIQCSMPNCDVTFHPQCAQEKNLLKIYVANPTQSYQVTCEGAANQAQLNLPVYSGIGEDAQEVGKLGSGSIVNVLERYCGFARIKYSWHGKAFGDCRASVSKEKANDVSSASHESSWVRIKSGSFFLQRSQGQEAGQILFAATCPKHSNKSPFFKFYNTRTDWSELQWGSVAELKALKKSEGENTTMEYSSAIQLYDSVKHFPLSSYIVTNDMTKFLAHPPLQTSVFEGNSPRGKADGRRHSRRFRKPVTLRDKMHIALVRHLKSKLRKLQIASEMQHRERASIVNDEHDPQAHWCFCRQPQHTHFNPKGMMLECEKCHEWFHDVCLGVSPQQVMWLEDSEYQWKCPICEAEDLDPQPSFPVPPSDVEDLKKRVDNENISHETKGSNHQRSDHISVRRSLRRRNANSKNPSLFAVNKGIMRIPVTKELREIIHTLESNRKKLQTKEDTSLTMKIPVCNHHRSKKKRKGEKVVCAKGRLRRTQIQPESPSPLVGISESQHKPSSGSRLRSLTKCETKSFIQIGNDNARLPLQQKSGENNMPRMDTFMQPPRKRKRRSCETLKEMPKATVFETDDFIPCKKFYPSSKGGPERISSHAPLSSTQRRFQIPFSPQIPESH